MAKFSDQNTENKRNERNEGQSVIQAKQYSKAVAKTIHKEGKGGSRSTDAS